MEEMQTRLKAMEYHLKITNQRIQEVKQDFGDDCDNFLAQQLHYDQSADFENIKKLTGFLEYRRILEDEKTDLEIKLGLKKTSNSPEHNKNYPELCKWLAEQQGEKQLDPALKAIISQIDVYSPIIAHKSMDEGDNILFTFNLRQKEDCKLFMIAASLYLEYRHSKNKDIFRELYTRIFPGEVAPKSMYALSGAINQLGISLLVAAYRIEELMLFFSRTEHPHKKPSIDIDHVFGTARHSIFSFIEKRTKNPPELSIAMRNFFKTKIEDRASDHDDIELKSVRQPLAS